MLKKGVYYHFVDKDNSSCRQYWPGSFKPEVKPIIRPFQAIFKKTAGPIRPVKFLHDNPIMIIVAGMPIYESTVFTNWGIG